MSNVLIGIIGVILFIGLALAGALFLGPEFQRSTNNSRAAAATQSASQIANAINLHNVQTGQDFPTTAVGTIAALASGGYLKSVPNNPVGTGAFGAYTQTGADASTTNPAYMVAGSVTNPEVCDAIHRQATGAASAPSAATAAALQAVVAASVAGCVNVTTAVNDLSVGRWVFVRV